MRSTYLYVMSKGSERLLKLDCPSFRTLKRPLPQALDALFFRVMLG